jgi:hypothetical protein
MFFSKPSGLQYVFRGDPSNYDFNLGALSIDGAWHILNLASLIPANAKLVHLGLCVIADTIGLTFSIKKSSIVNDYNISSIVTQNSYTPNSIDVIVDCTAQQIKYRAYTGTWDTLGIIVMGWFI